MRHLLLRAMVRALTVPHLLLSPAGMTILLKTAGTKHLQCVLRLVCLLGTTTYGLRCSLVSKTRHFVRTSPLRARAVEPTAAW